MRSLIDLLSADDGATAVEYGLLTLAVSVTCITLWISMGTSVKKPFVTVESAVSGANAAAGG